jgi:radical SAM superfamily enzyme YgiQ (UPF0313 family)
MREKKILLIDPPFYQLYKDTYSSNIYPLSLGYLAASIKKHTDWEVMVYNSDFSPLREPFHIQYFKGEGFCNYLKNLKDLSADPWEKIRKIVRDYTPSVVGISAKSPTFASVIMTAKTVKDIDKDIYVIAGGPHVTVMKEKILKEKHIDICVIGEGEKTLVDLLLSLQEKSSLRHIRGIIYRENGSIIINPRQLKIKDLDSLGFPCEYAPKVLYSYEKHRCDSFSHIMASRGCPYKCFFCSSRDIWGSNVRFRSTENIVTEMLKLREKNINFIHFDDDTFGVKNLKSLTGAIKENLPELNWSCEMHVNLITEENLKYMKEGGCTLIKMGIESGNNEILKAIRKDFTVEKALKACKLIKQYAIELETFFMTGFPQEREETMKDTLRVIEEIDSDKIIYSIFTPYEGTESFNYCLNRGLIHEDYDPSLHNHQSPLNCFCEHITSEKFREISCDIEKIVAEKNILYRQKKSTCYGVAVFLPTLPDHL